jgi:hypothetical protein
LSLSLLLFPQPGIHPKLFLHHSMNADCVYEPEHAYLIKSMAQRHLSSQADPIDKTNSILPSKLLLTCPLRPTHQSETDSINIAFPTRTAPTSSTHALALPPSTTTPTPSTSLQLCITQQRDITGYDDFGPPTLQSSADLTGRRSRGGETLYREYVVQWCCI